jgi:Bacterial PH domain
VVCLIALARWMNASRLLARAEDQSKEVPYPRSSRVMAASCSIFSVGMLAWCLFWPNESVTWWVITGFAVFAVFAIGWWLDCVVARLRLTEDALMIRTPLGSSWRLPWEEVRRLRYSPWFKQFRLEGHDGRIVRISVQRMGLPDFATLALEAVPPSAINTETRCVLEETAAGRPPLAWD